MKEIDTFPLAPGESIIKEYKDITGRVYIDFGFRFIYWTNLYVTNKRIFLSSGQARGYKIANSMFYERSDYKSMGSKLVRLLTTQIFITKLYKKDDFVCIEGKGFLIPGTCTYKIKDSGDIYETAKQFYPQG